MLEKEHGKGWWKFHMHFIFWECNKERFWKIFDGWHYKGCKHDSGNITLYVYQK